MADSFASIAASLNVMSQAAQSASGGVRQVKQDLEDINPDPEPINRFNNSLNGLNYILQRMLVRQAFMEIETVVKEAAATWTDAMGQITATTGATGADLQAFAGGLQDVIGTVGVKATDLADIMGNLSSALKLQPGDDNLVRITEEVGALSTITGVAAKTMTDDVIKIVRAWQIDPSQVEGFLNVLLATTQQYHVTFQALEQDLVKFAPLFEQLGVGREQAAAFIGVLTQGGVDAGVALTGLQTAMDKMAKAGISDIPDALAASITAIRNTTSESKQLSEAVNLFGTQAGPVFVKMLHDGVDVMGQLYTSTTTVKSSIDDQVVSVISLQKKWQDLIDTFSKSTIGQTIGQAVQAFLGDLKTVLQEISKGIDEVNALQNKLTSGTPLAGVSNFSLANPGLGMLGAYNSAVINGVAGLMGIKTSAPGASALGTPPTGTFFGQNGAIVPGTNQGLSFTMGGGKITASDPLAWANANYSPGQQSASDAAKTLALLNGDKKGKADPLYSELKQEVDALSRRFDAKNNIDFLQFQQSFYQQALGPNPTEAQSAYSDYFGLNQKVTFDQKHNTPVSSATYQQLSDLMTKSELAGMDDQKAATLLGLPNPETIQNTVTVLAAAFAQIEDNVNATAGYVNAAWLAMTNKMISDAAKAGESVSAALAQSNLGANIQNQINTQNFVGGAKTLGVTLDQQSVGNAAIALDAYNKIVLANITGNATANDVLNAQIGLLNAQAKSAKDSGQAFDDVSQEQLNYLNSQKQIDSMNTEGALAFFGLKSQADLDNAVDVIDQALTKIQVQLENNTGAVQYGTLMLAQFDAINLKLQQARQTGATVSNQMVQDVAAASAAAALATNDLGKAISQTGVTTTASVEQNIALLTDDLSRIEQQFGTSSAEYAQAQIAVWTKTTTALQQTGQAVPIALTQQLDQMKTAFANASMTIDQAYSTIGIKSASTVENSLSTIRTALYQISQDETVNAAQMYDANTLAAQQYFSGLIATHQSYNKADKSLNDTQVEQVKLALSDQENRYTQLGTLVKDVWTSLDNDIASGLTGVINGTQSVSAAFLKMGQDIEAILIKYVLNQLIFTQSNLLSLQSAVKQMFGAQSTTVAAAAPTAYVTNPQSIATGSAVLGAPPQIGSAVTAAISPDTQAVIDALNKSATNLADSGTKAGQMLSQGGTGAQAAMYDGGSTFDAGVTGDAGVFQDGVGTATGDFSSGIQEATTGLGDALKTSVTGVTQTFDSAGAGFSEDVGAAAAVHQTSVDTAAATHSVAVDTSAAGHSVLVDAAAADHSTSVVGAAQIHITIVTQAANQHAGIINLAAIGHAIKVAAAAVAHAVQVTAAATWHALQVTAAAAGHAISVTAAAIAHALHVGVAAAAHAAQVVAASITHGTAVTTAAATHATAVTTSAGVFAGEVDGAGAGLAGELDGAGAGIVAEIEAAGAEIDAAGAAFAGEADGAGAGLAGELDGAGAGFAGEVDGAGAAFASEVTAANAGATAAAAAGSAAADAAKAASQAAGEAASAAGDAATGLLGTLSGMTGLFTGISAVVGIASGIVSGIQQAHANNLLDLIEKNTRACDITLGGTGDADGISQWMKTTGQKVTALLDFCNNDLRQYLQNMNIDLDAIAGGAGGVSVVQQQIDWSPLINALQAIYSELMVIITTGNSMLEIMQQNASVVHQQSSTVSGVSSQMASHTSKVAQSAASGSSQGAGTDLSGILPFPGSNAYTDLPGYPTSGTPQYPTALTQDSYGITGTNNNPTLVPNPTPASLTDAATHATTAAATAAQAAYEAAVQAYQASMTAGLSQNAHSPQGIDPITGVLFSLESSTQQIQDTMAESMSATQQLTNAINNPPPIAPLTAFLGQAGTINPFLDQGQNPVDAILQAITGPGGEAYNAASGTGGITAATLNKDFGLNLTQATFDSQFVPAFENQLSAVLPDPATIQSMTQGQLTALVQSALTPEFWTAWTQSLGATYRATATTAAATAVGNNVGAAATTPAYSVSAAASGGSNLGVLSGSGPFSITPFSDQPYGIPSQNPQASGGAGGALSSGNAFVDSITNPLNTGIQTTLTQVAPYVKAAANNGLPLISTPNLTMPNLSPAQAGFVAGSPSSSGVNGPWTINIQNPTFPVGMTPNQVADSLMTMVRQQMGGLIR